MGEEDIRRQQPQRRSACGCSAPRCVARRHRHRDPEGRHQRGDARLGRARRRRPTTPSAPSSARTPTRMIVRDFQWVIGGEARRADPGGRGPPARLRRRLRRRRVQRRRHVHPFIDDDARRAGRRRGRRPRPPAGDHAASPRPGQARRPARRPVLRPPGRRRPDPADVHSISAGLDYPGVGPEHAFWKDTGRVAYERASDDAGPRRLPASSPAPRASSPPWSRAHAIALARQAAQAGQVEPGTLVVLNLSGRGDKDVETVASLLARRRHPTGPAQCRLRARPRG